MQLTNATNTCGCIQDLFEQCVQSYPDNPALVFQDKSLTYTELNQQVNQLAHYLKQLGIQPETWVGIHLHRSIEMIVAILAIFKAGGAYLPLDPTYPTERLGFMLKDSQLKWILTQQPLESRLNQLATHNEQPIQCICLDSRQDAILKCATDNLTTIAQPQHLAYVIYTSGSTGTPKGTLLEHQGLYNLAQAQASCFKVAATDRVLQFATLNFDASIWEIIMALSQGACLCVGSAEQLAPGIPLAEFIRELGVNIATLPPSALAILPNQSLPDLHTLIVAGETCPADLVNRWKVGRRFFNAYGPTETTVCATVEHCKETRYSEPPAIGYALMNMYTYVLDTHMQPVAANETGELYIGGIGIARGYHNRPELNKNKFCANPFVDQHSHPPHPRLYKTGDVVKALPDGKLLFVGRIDNQLKIRGFRIEPEEIESILNQHPHVKQSIVVAETSANNINYLNAYLISNLQVERLPIHLPCLLHIEGQSPLSLITQNISCGGVALSEVNVELTPGQKVQVRLRLPNMAMPIMQSAEVSWQRANQAGLHFIEPTLTTKLLCKKVKSLLRSQGFIKALQRNVVTELRSLVKDKLPAYMRPQNYTFLEKLPLTANGKVNRGKFKNTASQQTFFNDNQSFIAPRNPIEQQLADIWQLVLQVDCIGIEDDFFALGGTSLTAMQLLNQIEQAFAVEAIYLKLLDTPTIAKQAELIKHARQGHPRNSLPPIISTRQKLAPLSYAQQQIWLSSQLLADVPLYNEPCVIHFGSFIEAKVLERCINELRQRHAILRTQIIQQDGRPMQCVRPFMPEPLHIVDLSQLAADKAEQVGEQIFAELLRKPFELAEDSLFRCVLLSLGSRNNRLCIAMHHIIFDGVSMQILFDELEAIYLAFLQNQDSPLAKPKVQYVDFAIWQQQHLSATVFAQDIAYWQQQLADFTPLEIPTDLPRPAQQTYTGARYHLVFSKQLSQNLRTFSQQHGVTLFMSLYAAFSLLLSRYSGLNDISLSAVASVRSVAMNSVLGYFLNTMILRLQLSSSDSFLDLVQQAKRVLLEAHEHQNVPFSELVKALQPHRQQMSNPFARVSFTVEPPMRRSVAGWIISQVSAHNGMAKSDLTVEIDDLPEQLIARFEYSTELFYPATIERLAGHFEYLLTQILQNPSAVIEHFSIVPPAERKQLLAWTETQQAFPDQTAVQHLFEVQVQRTPQAIALSFADQQLSYEQLNGLANQLAHYLIKQGATHETLVGIYVARSPSLVICTLAVLKASAAFLPLDVNYPNTRIQHILTDAQASYLLTEADLSAQLALPISITCIDINSIRTTTVLESWDNPQRVGKPQDLAYVIYTSGSTGIPKGVQLEQQGLCNLVVVWSEYFKVKRYSQVLQFASFGFDAAVLEIMSTLVAGATLHVVAKPQLMPGIALMQTLQQRQISHVILPPSALCLMQSDALPELQTLVVAGEACPLTLAQQWSQGRDFYNAYGPTEATVWASVLPCTPDMRQISIGWAISNVELYILDATQQLVPIGVAGELYIGGVGVARGYLNRPELNAERFIAHPFKSDHAQQLYKTGDLARYLPDGQLEFLGRIDQQVKLRGYRIELGEIENVLCQHPQINDCVVVAYQNKDIQQLIAYLVLVDSTSLSSIDELQPLDSQPWRDYLQVNLPEYMIPHHYIGLAQLPITANGKVDRKQLTNTEVLQHLHTSHYIAPRTALELQLVKIWEVTLNKQPIGVTHDFFELGGYSLLAVKLFATIEQQMGYHLPLSLLFQANTIERLAHSLSQDNDVSAYWSPLVPIQTQGSRSPLFCVPGMGGNVIYFHAIARCLGDEQPLYGFQSRGLDGQHPPLSNIPEIAALYIEAMRKQQPHGPYTLVGHSMGSLVAFEMAKQLEAVGEHVPKLFIMDTPAVLNPVKPEELNWDDAQWLSQIAFALHLISGKTLDMGLDTLRRLNTEQQLLHFQTELKRAGLLPADGGLAQLNAIVQVIKHNELAIMRYSIADSEYGGQLILLRTSEIYDDVLGILGELHANENWGWQAVAQQTVKMHLVSGDHRTMLIEPHVQTLADTMRLYL